MFEIARKMKSLQFVAFNVLTIHISEIHRSSPTLIHDLCFESTILSGTNLNRI